MNAQHKSINGFKLYKIRCIESGSCAKVIPSTSTIFTMIIIYYLCVKSKKSLIIIYSPHNGHLWCQLVIDSFVFRYKPIRLVQFLFHYKYHLIYLNYLILISFDGFGFVSKALAWIVHVCTCARSSPTHLSFPGVCLLF